MKSSLASFPCLFLFVASALAQAEIEQLEQEALFAAASEAAPYVVKIDTIGGAERVGSQLVSSAPTSGIIVGADGYVVSSAFAVEQDPNSILVELPNGKRRAAEIVSRDTRYGLVLLKVEVDEPLRVPTPGHSGSVEVGQWAVTVARTLPGDDFNMSVGIVSAKDRVWGKAIQVDANVSASNYGGALVGIDGQILGVLVPLSPNSGDVAAGSEWYDSGIGFAVPLDRVLRQLEQWKDGDLAAGKMGIAMKSENLYGSEPVIGVCRPKSPARDADLRPDDKIISANGIPVASYAQMKHILGPMLAGDLLELEVQRGDDILKKSMELTDKLEPYEHAFLGILPSISNGEAGVAIRFVFQDSPAADASLAAGDRIMEVDGQAVADETAFRQLLAGLEPEQEIEVKYSREDEDGEEPRTAKLTLTAIGDLVPESVPSRFEGVDALDEDLPPLGKIDIKLPEEVNDCQAYIPESYDPRFEHALLVLLPVSGEKDINGLIREWRDGCNATRTILLVPQSNDEQSWDPAETQFIRKTIDNLRKDYEIDSDRIVVCGHDNSGAMAYLTGFTFRDLVRGVATLRAAIPSSAPATYNEPLQRLSFWIAGPEKARLTNRIESNVEMLRELKFAVTQSTSESEKIDDEIRDSILLWLDTLDRL